MRSILSLAFACLSLSIAFARHTPFALTVQIDSIQDVDCLHNTGLIKVSAIGGTPAYAYLWNTGATTAMISNLIPGTYSVTVTDAQANTAASSVTIISNMIPPSADAGGDAHVSCSNDTLVLNGSGSVGNNFKYLWTATANGHIVSGGQSLTPKVDHTGTYTLVVTDISNGCTASSEMKITSDYNARMANATGGVINCSTPSLTLQVVFDTINSKFVWNGPNNFQSGLRNPVVSLVGNYVFKLTDTITGCITKSTAIVLGNFTQPDAQANGGDTLTCAMPNLQLLGVSITPGVSFKWIGPNGFSSNQQNPVVNAVGVYTLTVTNPANGCTNTDTETVLGNFTSPAVSIQSPATLTCALLSVQLQTNVNLPFCSFLWSGPNGFGSTQQNPIVTTPGSYRVTVTNTKNGCTGTAQATVLQNITSPNVSASGGVKTCTNPSVTLIGNSTTQGVSFSWTGPNNFNSAQQSPTVSTVGIYTLKVTNPINGCTAVATAQVSQNTTAPNISATVSGTLTCNVPNVNVTASSTTQGVTYSWTGPNNFSSTLASPLVGLGGYYYPTVTNPANGCTNSSSVFVNENKTPPFAYGGDDRYLNCNFNSVVLNGSFSSSGPNFSYLWTTTNGNIVMGATTQYLTVNAAGLYFYQVTNTQNGCKSKDSVTVEQLLPVQANITLNTPVSCSGGSDGKLTVSGSGGSEVYTYTWSSGANTQSISNLQAGSYTVTVIDNQGCSASKTATVEQLILLAPVASTNQSAPGVNDGTASVFPAGGTPPYTVKWSNGKTTPNIFSLAPGSYTVTVTDSKSCTISKTVNVVAANCTIAGTLSSNNLNCFGINTGSASISITGAANPVSYSWSNGASTASISNLPAGTYTVTATDIANCKVTQTAVITAPTALVANVSNVGNILCAGANNGTLTAGVNGGTQPYSYKWSNGPTTLINSNLAPGPYTFTATDNKGCTATISATITSPQPLDLSVANLNNIPCSGANNGSITMNAVGGTTPYTYKWSNGATTATINNLPVGTYSLTLTDANNCTKSLNAQIELTDHTPPVMALKNAVADLGSDGIATITPAMFDNGISDAGCGIAAISVNPNSFNCTQLGTHTVTLTATDLNGNSSTGTASVTIQDNIIPSVTCPGNFHVSACNNVVNYNNPSVVDNCTVNPSQLVRITGLASGSTFPSGVSTQLFRYTDANGNKGECSFYVQVDDAVSVNPIIKNANCNACDGQINLIQTAGPTAGFSWSNNQGGNNVNALCAGDYTVTITDANGCILVKTYSIVVGADAIPPTITCPNNVTLAACNSVYTYSMPSVNDNCAVDPALLVRTSGLASGSNFPPGPTNISYSYTDGGNNTVSCSFTVNVLRYPSLNPEITHTTCANTCNGTILLHPEGGSSPLSFQWSNAQGGVQNINLCAGNYTVTLTDANNCTMSATYTIVQPPALGFAVSQVIDDFGALGIGSITIVVAGGVQPYSYNWTKNGLPFSTNKDLFNLNQGTYKVTVTDANSCTISSNPVVVSTNVNAISEPLWAESLVLQPNPASEWANLVFQTPLDADLNIQILSQAGQVCLQQTFSAQSPVAHLDLTKLPAGLWLVRLSGEDGSQVLRKLVILR